MMNAQTVFPRVAYDSVLFYSHEIMNLSDLLFCRDVLGIVDEDVHDAGRGGG